MSSAISSTMRGQAEEGLVDHQQRGRAMRPRAIATICCSPPDSVCASWSRARLGRRGRAPRPARASPRDAAGRAGLWAPSSTFSRTVRKGNRRRRSSTCAMPMPDDAVRRAGRRCAGRRNDAPGARAQQPRDRVHERRLAGAVRAEDADDLARRHAELGLPQHLEVAVGDVEPSTAAARFDGRASRLRLAEIGLDHPRSRATASGGPSAMTSPRCSATMRCATAVITRMLCSMTRSVRPPACSSRTSSHQAGDAALVDAAGHLVEEQQRGPVASARASSRRLRWPVESVRACASRLLAEPDRSSQRARLLARVRARRVCA